ncbi:MAG: Acetyl-CoA acetyltransferase [Alphaproteobacteria bacterium MarineAlpha11_Bin1]|nr:MAG: Acetyl-CoA acetyltransferase [Alphaproteobacteria bacterium MarineAlpha11_Bin1]|tara:strand:+ start:12460 stop:13764 length:1305 start_codon:yes stop_codon:yes gene_type:complete
MILPTAYINAVPPYIDQSPESGEAHANKINKGIPMTEAYIPYGGYWSTPFAKWQGTLSHLNSIELAAYVAKIELDHRCIDPSDFDMAVLGYTVPQHKSFYGTPWMMGLIGAEKVTGPTVAQACATSARCLQNSAMEIGEMAKSVLVVTADRTSNGPNVYYPNPLGPGGMGISENWVLDSFGYDPYAKVAMVDTAENVARRWQISTQEQHDVVAQRYEQYGHATANDNAFHKRFMRLPFSVPDQNYRTTIATMTGDEGIFKTTREGLNDLKPVMKNGSVTFAGQTHPADGNTSMIITTRDMASTISTNNNIEIRLAGFGQARTNKAFMPHAPVPASQQALRNVGISLDDITAVKTHNPFAVNDIVFCRETGYDITKMNNYGCSLIWGHPQGPTGLRAICELIEELVIRGGGYGLFNGCAAGDSSMAAIIQVRDAT